MMEVKVLKEKAKELEIEVDEKNETILNPLKERLLRYESVSYVECSKEHPLLSRPRIYVRVNEGKPRDIVVKALRDLQKEFKSFREQIEKKK